jgi:ribokinase
MSKILVSGIVNIENNLKVDAFPILYNPVNFAFFGIHTSPGGVGYNIAKALKTLGDEVQLLSIIGDDLNGDAILSHLLKLGISTETIKKYSKNTPQSIILYDIMGKRQIFTDLKNVQELEYPLNVFQEQVVDCEILVMCNVNFSRNFLKYAKEQGKIIATDIQAISSMEDPYNQDFLNYGDILFFSNDKLGEDCEGFLKQVSNKYQNKIVVVGMGYQGALMYVREDNFLGRFKAHKIREVVNTVGAGDALFSSFVHFYAKEKDPYDSIQKAMIFAGYKIGESGSSNGFLTEKELQSILLEDRLTS